MQRLIALCLLLAGCGTGTGVGDNTAAPAAEGDRAVKAAVQTASLTGLYEGGAAEPRSQLCILDRGSGDSRFGLVVWGRSQASCSGAGSAVRRGNVLRLTMEGDEPCLVEAALEGSRVTFPASLPAGCAYYCGAGASIAGAAFEKVGGTAADAARARDLVGDPLCG